MPLMSASGAFLPSSGRPKRLPSCPVSGVSQPSANLRYSEIDTLKSAWPKNAIKPLRHNDFLRCAKFLHFGSNGRPVRSAIVKVFGCRPFAEACRRAETGPAFENLQGRKPRVGRAPIRRTRYGDLGVASVCWRVVAMTIKDDFGG